MIGKISPPGKSFAGILSYTLQEEKEPQLIASNIAGRNPSELGAELRRAYGQNTRVKKPVFHASLSSPRGEELTIGQWNQIATRWVDEMGYTGSPWVAIRHRDTEHDHVHIVASRVDRQGKRVADFQEKRRGEVSLRGLEKGMGLRQVQPSWETGQPALNRDQAAQMLRTGQATPKVAARAAIELAVKDRPTLGQFVRRLRRHGVEIRLNVQSTGRIAGASFRVGETTLKASKVGRGYSWGKLLERIDYEPERDQPMVDRLRLRKTAELQPEIESAARQAEVIASIQQEPSVPM